MKNSRLISNSTPVKLKSLLASRIFSFGLALVSGALALNSAHAQSGTWINTSSGSWASSANWSGGTIANGSGSTANFSTLTLGATNAVTLDGVRTIGNMLFGDQGNAWGWRLNAGSGGPLTLAVSSGSPTITVNNQIANMGIGLIAGTSGLTKAGNGTLEFINGQPFAGGMSVSQGAVSFIYSNTANSVGASIGTGPITLNDANTGANDVSLLLGRAIGTSQRPNLTNAIVVANNGSGQTIIGSDNISIVFAQFSGPLTLNKSVTLQCGNNNGDRTSFNGQITGTGDLYVSVLNPVNSANRVSIQHPSALAANDFNGNIILNENSTLQLLASGDFINKVIPDGSSIGFNPGSVLRLSPANNDFETVGTLISLGADDSGSIFLDTASKTLTLTIGADGRSGSYGGTIRNTAGTLAVTKTGSGTQIFSGNFTYSGATIISNGTLSVNGWLGSGAVTVQTNGTLSGIGVLNGAVTVQAGGTLAPGTSTLNDGLTINNNLTLAGNVKFNISKGGGAPAQNTLSGMTSVTYGGTLIVTNITSNPLSNPLADGDTFYLFSAGSYSASYFVAYQLPVLPNGLTWDVAGLLTGGYIKVTSATATPVFNPAAGGYASPQSITISSDSGSKIFYTTDGSTPTASSPSGNSPVVITLPANANSFVIHAYATKNGYSASSVVSSTFSTTPVPTWKTPLYSSWAAAANWSNNVVANASGVSADFSKLALTANTTITLDSTPTVGKLKFADAGGLYNWILNTGSAGSLNLDAGVNVPIIEVDNANTTIVAIITGANGLTKTGNGTLTLSGANTFTGTTTITNGTLKLETSALPSATAVLSGGTISNSATVQFYRGSTGYTPLNSKLSGAGDYFVDGPGGGNNDYRFIFKGTNSDNTGTIHIINSGNLWLDPTAGVGGQAQSTAIGDSSIVEVAPLAKFFVHYSVLSETIGGLSGSGNVYANNSPGQPILTPVLIVGGGNQSASFSGVIQNGTGQLSLAKTGSGTQDLSGTNTYTGATTISNGTLTVNGALGSTTNIVSVQSAGTLSGLGTIGGAITVNGTFAPGTNHNGTLTCGGNLTLNAGSTSTFAVNGSMPTNSSVALGSLVNYGGTLNILPTGTFSAGQSFTLFSGAGAVSASNFDSIAGSPGAGLHFSFTNGVLSVVSTDVAPVTLSNSLSGRTLTLTWPTGQGWRLVGQTNALSTGLNTNPAAWFTVSGLADGSAAITIVPTNPTVFYRLVNP